MSDEGKLRQSTHREGLRVDPDCWRFAVQEPERDFLRDDLEYVQVIGTFNIPSIQMVSPGERARSEAEVEEAITEKRKWILFRF